MLCSLISGYTLTILIILSGFVVSSAQQTTNIQFVNTASSLEVADVYIDGILLVDNLAVGSGTTYFEISSLGSTQIVVAPAESTSIADSLFSVVTSTTSGGYHTAVILDDQSQPKLRIYSGLKTNSESPLKIDMAFLHASPTAPPMNVVIRDGDMVVGNLHYGEVSGYTTYLPEDYYFDVKVFGTSDIISTYRFSPQGSEGDALSILITGETTSATSLKLWIVYPDGFVALVDYAPVARVQYMNVASDTVDVYKNGTKFSDNASPGLAMPFKYIPAELAMNIAVNNQESLNALNAYSYSSFTFSNGVAYTAISCGVINSTEYPMQMIFFDHAQEYSGDDSTVATLFFNGAHLFPEITIQEASVNVFDPTAYGHYQEYQQLTASAHEFKVLDAQQVELGTFSLSLDTLGGQAMTLYSRNSEVNGGLEIWMALRDGRHNKLFPTIVGTNSIIKQTHTYLIGPNPVVGSTLYISNISAEHAYESGVSFRLCDSTGKLIKCGELDFSQEEATAHIGLEGVGSGVFILQIEEPGVLVNTFKIIK